MNKRISTSVFAILVLAWFTSAAAYAQEIPTFTQFYISGGQLFAATMAGDFPVLGNTTHIPVTLVPLTVIFEPGGQVFDPLQIVSHGDSPVSFVLKSPLFKAATFDKHPETNDAPTQWLDAYQRANFWSTITGGTSRNNPVKRDFHILLDTPQVAPWFLAVPAWEGSVDKDSNGDPNGHINWPFFDQEVRALLPLFPAKGLTIFLLGHIDFPNWSNGGPNSVAGGYHLHMGNQTYIVDGFDFNGPDVEGLSHELAEWLADPFISSTTPGWRKTASSDCSHRMEVGDPMHGHVVEMQFHGDTFHLEDLAFLSWFAPDQPSTAINGWRTFFNSDVPHLSCQ